MLIANCRSYANGAQLGLDEPDDGPLPEAFLDDLCTHVQVHKIQYIVLVVMTHQSSRHFI